MIIGAAQAHAQTQPRNIFPQGYDDGLRDGKNDVSNHTAYVGHCPQSIIQFSKYCAGYYNGYDVGYKGSNSTLTPDQILGNMQRLER